MNNLWPRNFAQGCRWIALAGAMVYILMYVGVALIHLSYPYELECLEGMGVDHVQRILDGKLLYVPPNVDFVPSIYTPLYYYVSALPAALLGVGPLPLRLVSLLASLGCMALIFVFVRRESGQTGAALLGVGLFAATYFATEARFDLARVDMLFVFLLMLAFWLVRRFPSRGGYLAAALAIALATMTKQTGLLAGIGFAAYGLMQRRKSGLWLAGGIVLFTGLSVLLMDLMHGGWFCFYTMEVPAKHRVEPIMFIRFVPQDLLRPLPLASLLCGLFLLLRLLKGARAEVWFYVLMGMSFAAVAGAPRVKEGNAISDLIPLYTYMAVLFGVAVPAIRQWLHELFAALPADYPQRERLHEWLSAFFWVAIIAQLCSFCYGPQNVLPTAADRAAGAELVRKMASFKGDIWLTHHGYLGTLAGKPAHAMAQPVLDMLYADNKEATRLFNASLDQALREKRFDAIISDFRDYLALGYRCDYAEQPLHYGGDDDFWPVTGYRIRPTHLYVPQNLDLMERPAP